jgi:hypothetical protein
MLPHPNAVRSLLFENSILLRKQVVYQRTTSDFCINFSEQGVNANSIARVQAMLQAYPIFASNDTAAGRFGTLDPLLSNTPHPLPELSMMDSGVTKAEVAPLNNFKDAQFCKAAKIVRLKGLL